MIWFYCPQCGRPIYDPSEIFTTSCVSMCTKCAQEKHGKIVSLDFDAVCAKYDGWKGDHYCGEPIEGVVEFIKKLVDNGFSIIISTARGVLEPVNEWIAVNGLDDYIEMITNKKPAAHIYIDDRGFHFDGKTSFDDIFEYIINFKPYWYKG